MGYRNPTAPETVADTLFRAVESRDDTLRHVVGNDARQWIEGRRAATDEEWRELGTERSLEDFLRFAEGLVGPGMFRG